VSRELPLGIRNDLLLSLPCVRQVAAYIGSGPWERWGVGGRRSWPNLQVKKLGTAWCREHGVYPTGLETWKPDAIGGHGEPRETESLAVKQDRRRIKELGRESHLEYTLVPAWPGPRAETAALLLMSRKLAAIFHDGEDK
jgi:transposase